MSTLDSIRDFLTRYQQGDYRDSVTVTQPGRPPADWVRTRQQSMMDSADEHVIPLSDFEYRLKGEDADFENDPKYVRTENAINSIESVWDQLVAGYGLNAVSIYLPFHKDEATYGIYLRQRGIRYLGHLLYQWSRVGNLCDTPAEATEFLFEHDFQDGDRLFQAEPVFDSEEDAFALAEEILLRHQWFHHQVELLAAYTEDSADQLYYSEYHDRHLSTSEIGGSIEESVANAYVAQSRACVNKSPSALFSPLLQRALAGRDGHRLHYTEFTDNKFNEGCYEISRHLLSNGHSNPGSRGVELARQLIFSTDIESAVPSRISVFITRRESDLNTASYKQEIVLDGTYSVDFSDQWEDDYDNADGNVKDLIDTVVDKAQEIPPKIDKKGKGVGPKNVFYGSGWETPVRLPGGRGPADQVPRIR